MSRIQSLLDILIQVKDTGLGSLNKYQTALQALLQAEANLNRQRKQHGQTIQTLNALQANFVATIENEARQTLEALRVEKQMVRARQEGLAAIRNRRIALAQLALSQGDYSKAEQRLQQALRITTTRSLEYVRIQQLLLRVSNARTQAAAAEVSATVRQGLAEAALARAKRETRKEIEILTRTLKTANITKADSERVTLALARAETRLAKDTERARKEAERQKRELESQRGVLATISAGYNRFTRILSSFVLIGFTVRTVFRSLDRFIVQPIVELAKQTLNATDNFRRMEASLAGVVGAGRGVRSLVADIREASRGLPVTTLEAISGVRGLAFTPGTAQLLTRPQGPERQQGINELLRVLTGLATIDPEQGIEGAKFAVREALAGEFRSLRFRFELSPQVIAAGIGKDLTDLKGDPELTLRALSKFVDDFVGDEAIAEFNRLLSVQANRLRGSLEEFFALIGDQGFYDKFTTLVRNLADAVQGGLDGADGRQDLITAARLINNSLERSLDALLAASSSALARITGRQVDLATAVTSGDVATLATAIASIIENLSRLASGLVSIVPDLLATLYKFIGGPTTAAEARAEIAALDKTIANRQFAQSAINRARFFGGLGSGVQSLGEPPAIAVRLGLASSTSQLVEQRRRAQERLSIFEAFERREPTRPEPTAFEQHTDALRQNIRQLQSFERVLGQATDGLPALSDSDTLLGNLNRINIAARSQADSLDNTADLTKRSIDALRSNFQNGQFGELFNVLRNNFGRFSDIRSANPTRSIESLGRDEAASLIEGSRSAVATLREHSLNMAASVRTIALALAAEEQARKNYRETFRGNLLGALSGSEGFIRQLPDRARVQQGSDILSFILGANERSIPGIQAALSGSRFTGVSGIGSQLQDLQKQFGFTAAERFDPRLGDSIAGTIDLIADSVERLTGSAASGQATRDELVDDFVMMAKTLREAPGLAAEQVEELDIFIEKMEEVRDQTTKAVDDIQKELSQMSQSLSESLGSGVTDGILDVFETFGDNLIDIMTNVARSIAAIVLRMVVEIGLIRTIVNPLLNNAFGLQGSNQLPVIGNIFGAKGMIVSNGQVRTFARGYIATGPQSFQMRGGQRGVIGEEAPEAVLPLVQGRNGSLGVAAQGGGGPTTVVNFNVRTLNESSFRRQRRAMTRRASLEIGRR